MGSRFERFEDAIQSSNGDFGGAFIGRLLEQTGQCVDRVARSAGFTSSEQMRRAFARRFGVSPTDYRARFSRRDPEAEIDLDLLTDAWAAGSPPPAN